MVRGLSLLRSVVKTPNWALRAPSVFDAQKTTPTRQRAGWVADTEVKLGQLVGCETFRLRETQIRPINPAPNSP
jgi:hypothetical protein